MTKYYEIQDIGYYMRTRIVECIDGEEPDSGRVVDEQCIYEANNYETTETTFENLESEQVADEVMSTVEKWRTEFYADLDSDGCLRVLPNDPKDW